MTTDLAALAPRIRFNEQLLGAVLDGMTPDAWSRRPAGGGNSAHWILGHVTASRRLLARLAGAEVAKDGWEAAFGMGVDPEQHEGSYPAVEDLIAAMHAAGEAISERLASIGPDEADAPVARPFPDGSSTVRGAVHFLYMHEVYHLGQLGFIRRTEGLAGFA